MQGRGKRLLAAARCGRTGVLHCFACIMHEEALRDVEFGVRVWGWVSCRLLGSISSHHRIRLTMQALKVPGMVAGHRAVQQLRIMDTDASSIKNNEDEYHPDNVTTDDRDETWHAGQTAPAHIDLDLGSSAMIEHLDLLPYQVPTPATTHHRVWVGNSKDSMELVADIKQETSHHAWVSGVPVKKAGRYVRIETVEHPGWVAWSGIKVFGSQE